tara:strand:+ start:122 stop:280 length:159 start_codon:yes stop_codon:yes gene_type:complete
MQKKYITEDGYIFIEQENGKLACNGMMTYDSLEHLKNGDNPPYTRIDVREVK